MTPILKVRSILLAIIASTLLAMGATARAEIKDALRPKVLSPEAERALQPKQTFKECANCPEMVVVPAGSFLMGSPESEEGHSGDEGPQHRVTFAKAFAVSKYEVTFDDWDACVALGGCGYVPGDEGWGRGARPVIQVSWDDVEQYVAWLSRQTGKPYRLLSEAEWEYAARAGSDTAYPWGDEIGKGNANSGCAIGCRTASVGSFPTNAFGLHDMHGNVWEWVQDCYHFGYDGARTDGSAKTTGDCSDHVQRGGSWGCEPQCVRSAVRFGGTSRSSAVGFRLGRTLTP